MLTTRDLSIVKDLYYRYLSERAWEITASDPTNLIIFASILFVALVSMAIFRSPAVALMPDTTIKPLRSKANAIITLMGAVGGIFAVYIIMLSGLNRHTYDYHGMVYIIIGIVMLVTLGIFLWKVKEPKLVEQKRELDKKLGLQPDETTVRNKKTLAKLTVKRRASLYVLLGSVFLLFAGYNAVMSKLADYLPKVLNLNLFDYQFIIAQALVYFLKENQPWLTAIIIAGAGTGWIMISINTYVMVVELSKGYDVGRYTGYYYAASMTAQIFTPIFSGILMDKFGRLILFPYATFFIMLAMITMFFVNRGEAIKVKKLVLTPDDEELIE